MGERFDEEISSRFSLDFLEEPHKPVNYGYWSGAGLPKCRVNHYLVKPKWSDTYHYGELAGGAIERLMRLCRDTYSIRGQCRYCYITLDSGWVDYGETQRIAGWHLDGIQGDEVHVKQNGDFQFIWCNDLPTHFSTQAFDMRGCDLSKHDVNKWIAKQIQPEYVMEIQPHTVYLMNPYYVHKGAEAYKWTYRQFLRISYTHIPVTSTKMTVNPQMEYDYEIHSTDGMIPSTLV